MRFFFVVAISSAALLSQAVALTTPMVTPVETNVNAPASFPISTLPLSDEPANRTLAHADGALVARQEYPATLLMCSGFNCASCSTYNLASFPFNRCFFTGLTSYSVAISQPSGQGLPYAVVVSSTGCSSVTQLPAVNNCYNINGPAVNAFALLS